MNQTVNYIPRITQESEKDLRRLLDTLIEMILERERALSTLPVTRSDIGKSIQLFINEAPLPKKGLGVEQVFQEFSKRILPLLSNSGGPRYFGFMTGGMTPAAFIGDCLVSIWDQNVSHSLDSVAAMVEEETIHLLLDLFQLPRIKFFGRLTTGATASNILGLACARQWCGNQQGINVAEEGLFSLPPIKVYSTFPHASSVKALSIVGIGRKSLIKIASLPNRDCMDPQALEMVLQKAKSEPKIVIASTGESITGDFDDLLAISEICKKYNAWLHVDAAFGIFARCSEKFYMLTEKLELADSITADAHKWLNVPYDCGIFFTPHGNLLKDVFSSVAPFIEHQSSPPPSTEIKHNLGHPLNSGIENSRRFRALPVWMTLKAYGRAGYQELVERNCSFAQALGEWIQASPDYELLAPIRLNTVVFREVISRESKINQKLLDDINASGTIYITATVYHGQPALRATIANWRTTEADLKPTLFALRQAVTSPQKTKKSLATTSITRIPIWRFSNLFKEPSNKQLDDPILNIFRKNACFASSYLRQSQTHEQKDDKKNTLTSYKY